PRHDYEGLDSERASALMNALRESLPSLPGKTFGSETVATADEFSYQDPVDGSSSANQGIRVFFKNGGRLVFRLSGTGTSGATLRLYCESYERDPTRLEMDTQRVLSPLLEAADVIANIASLTGRESPDVIT
ncbi:MAG: alpha-D-glucose phosphate-specific phosphoglucomutase, partial [Halieaceae bacterium]|nr:alpha-D-glucose phosphate-specific phosphoglucomutase [Halieaceae bacterium]